MKVEVFVAVYLILIVRSFIVVVIPVFISAKPFMGPGLGFAKDFLALFFLPFLSA